MHHRVRLDRSDKSFRRRFKAIDRLGESDPKAPAKPDCWRPRKQAIWVEGLNRDVEKGCLVMDKVMCVARTSAAAR
jgi:hypothetical protein